MIAMKAVQSSGRAGSMRPRNFPAIVRCAVLLIGRNSVMPWMMPRRRAWRIVIGRPVEYKNGFQEILKPVSVKLRASWSLEKQRREHERDRAQELDENVERRARGVLERIADRIADDRRLVRIRALAAE